MWNESLELHTARSLEQNDCVSVEFSLEERPKIFNVRCRYHSAGVLLHHQRRSKFADSGNYIGSRLQCKTGDVSMTLG
jgi:hypothetical protein